jgi:hypothetical protein
MSKYYRVVYFEPQENITAYELACGLRFFFTECVFGPGTMFPIRVRTEHDWDRMKLLIDVQYKEVERHLRAVDGAFFEEIG